MSRGLKCGKSSLEDAFFLHAFPGQRAARSAEFVAHAGELLFARQELLTRLGPLGGRRSYV
jgi:hypothetical protein